MATIKCPVCLLIHEEGLRHDKDGKLEPPRGNATDDYFDALGDIVEAHPIGGHRRGGAGNPD